MNAYAFMDQNLECFSSNSDVGLVENATKKFTGKETAKFRMLQIEEGKHVYYIFITNRTFLVRFGGISGEFGRAMVRILARRGRAKIPMARPNEPDMPPKRTKKVRLGIYRTQIRM